MSKPRWIDGGVFRALRTATRKRTLTVIAGPGLGSAEVSCRTDLRAALGDGDRSALKEDARLKSGMDEGLRAAWTLRQPGLVTTNVSDAVLASAPDDLELPPRVFGPSSKGLASAYSRKDPFVMHLCGSAAGPDTLVLTQKDRKALLKPDSRYQVFLRNTFGRDVLFAGFSLDDPDLVEVLDDVGRVFNGHCPHNVALVQEGSSDPAAALRASMHYGMTVIEYPASLTASQALQELASVLEELEVPKPATGDPPRGYTEVTEAMRGAVPATDESVASAFQLGDSSSWSPIRDGLDVPRSILAAIQAGVTGDAPEGKVPVVLVKGRSGQGKTILARRLAWELSAAAPRVFWRESGVNVPDRYVPAEADDARAVFVCDDAHELETLPQLLKQLAREAGGKARLVLVADAEAWDRSGLDHRIRQDAAVVDVPLAGVDAEEAAGFAAKLSEAGRVAAGADVAAVLGAEETSLLDGLFQVTRGQDLAAACGEFAASLSAQPAALRGLLAVAFLHQYGLALGATQLANVTGVAEADLDEQVLGPTSPWLVKTAGGAIRTTHPAVAQALAAALAPTEEARHEMTLALLGALTGAASEEPGVYSAPSELIRAVRHGPLPPLVLASFFDAGEPAARNDVWFWFDRGRAEADFSRWDTALAAFDQALWRRPEETREKEHNALVQANRARCLQALGKKREALAATEEGLRALPQDAGLLRLHEKLGGRRRGGPSSGGPRGRGGDRRGGGGGRGGPGGGRGRGGPGGGGGGGRGAGGGAPGGRGAPARPGA